MFKPLDIQPGNPKNGDKYRSDKGTFEFRYGRWIKISNQVVEKKEDDSL